MSAHAEELAARRAQLAARIEAGRAELAGVGAELQRPFRAVRLIEQRASMVRHNVVWMVLPVALVAMLFPRPALRLAATAYAIWRALHAQRSRQLPK